jgi:hypothetical protein
MYFMPAERTCDGVNCEDAPMSGRTVYADDPLD